MLDLLRNYLSHCSTNSTVCVFCFNMFTTTSRNLQNSNCMYNYILFLQSKRWPPSIYQFGCKPINYRVQMPLPQIKVKIRSYKPTQLTMGTVIIGISSTKPKHVLRFAEHTFACSLPLCLRGTKRLNRSTEICFKKSIRRFFPKKNRLHLTQSLLPAWGLSYPIPATVRSAPESCKPILSYVNSSLKIFRWAGNSQKSTRRRKLRMGWQRSGALPRVARTGSIVPPSGNRDYVKCSFFFWSKI